MSFELDDPRGDEEPLGDVEPRGDEEPCDVQLRGDNLASSEEHGEERGELRDVSEDPSAWGL